jgi:hypothetical protein
MGPKRIFIKELIGKTRRLETFFAAFVTLKGDFEGFRYFLPDIPQSGHERDCQGLSVVL